jgi:hypothetical protein
MTIKIIFSKHRYAKELHKEEGALLKSRTASDGILNFFHKGK